MKYIATFDIGTTAVKGVIVDLNGKVVMSATMPVETIVDGSFIEQNPDNWYDAFCVISHDFFQKIPAAEIVCIIMSGQMQDLILFQKDGNRIGNAILYSDGRAQKQAATINLHLGSALIREVTGNNLDGSIPFAKLLWYQENFREIFPTINKIVFSSKDYVLFKLTGEFVSDVTSCSTTGLMNIYSKTWQTDWCEAYEILPTILPRICYCEEQVGVVTKSASQETGYQEGTVVFCGTGDAGSAAFAGGLVNEGDYNLNIGTTGWIATISEKPLKDEKIFNLAAIQQDIYINVVPFFNAGNVHQWIGKILSPSGNQINYQQLHQLLDESTVGSHGLFLLPYLVGERFPVMDKNIRGAYIGITANTTKQDLARAALEGVAFSIRQGLETIGKSVNFISIVGGGAKESIWTQIFADVLGHRIASFKNAEFLPAISLSFAAKVGLGLCDAYSEFINQLKIEQQYEIISPDWNNVKNYTELYAKFKEIYPMIKTFYDPPNV